MSGRLGLLVLTALLAFLLAGAPAQEQALAHQPQVAPLPPEPAAKIGGPFELVSHTGETVTDLDFRGRYALVFFGFTTCPDVCPMTLQNVALALETLEAEAEMVRVLFITVDHERDTPSVLGDYVIQFHPNMIGLTGSAAQIEAAAAAFYVHYRLPGKEDHGGPADTGLIEHSAYLYLLGPDGDYRHAFHHAASPETIAAKLRALISGS